MPKLRGDHYEAARALFQEKTKSGRKRCQAITKGKIRPLRERYGDDENIPLEDLVKCQCSRSAQPWTTVCHVHGAGKRGSNPGGRPVAHGAYSKILGPTSLRERYEDYLEDSILIELRDELALIMALISEALSRWADRPPALEEMADCIEGLGQALRNDDMVAAQDEYIRLTDAFMSGRGQWQALQDVRVLVDQKRKLAGTELARLQVLQQVLTVQQMMTYVAGVSNIIDRLFSKYELPDGARREAAIEFRSLANRAGYTDPGSRNIVDKD